MPYVIQHRRLESPLKMVKDWTECADSKRDTEEAAQIELQWWLELMKQYGWTGWEYRIQQVKK